MYFSSSFFLFSAVKKDLVHLDLIFSVYSMFGANNKQGKNMLIVLIGSLLAGFACARERFS